ncbi:MAG TPA: tetratricopeptide repeat protein [Puia sp.]|nr:tetratricopeptide repeat protein [Puia sp.]
MRISLLVLAVCLFLQGMAQKNPPINSREIILQGSQLHDSGSYKKALLVYDQIDRNDTNYVEALYEKALTCEADSQYEKALGYCREALALPQQREMEPQIYNVYGDILSDMQKPAEAIAVYDEAIRKYPAYSLLYFNKGLVYINQEQYAEAESWFRQTLLINPYMFSAHFYLGLSAIHEGKIIQGMLSLVGYLLMNPEGKYAGRAINILDVISNSKDEILSYKNSRTTEPDVHFASIEDIVLSKIALDKAYKPLLQLDDPISRQIQVVFEKTELDPASTDFWMQYYMPFYKSIYNRGEFEVFINWIFENVNIKVIKEYNKKNKKTIEAFKSEAADYFNLIRDTRELQADKREQQQDRYLFQDGSLEGKGRLDANKNFSGSWNFYYPAGNLKCRGQFDDAGKRTGDWTFYYVNGKLKSKETYHGGDLTGEHSDYFENGIKSGSTWYRDGKIDGQAIVSYWPGTLQRKALYKMDEPNGIDSEYFSDGNLRFVVPFVNGKMEGTYTEYYRSGGIHIKTFLKGGVTEGPYQSFYESGIPEKEGQIIGGKSEGLWKYYDESGRLKYKRTFLSDKEEGTEEEYFENGVLGSTANYKKGKLDGSFVEYDRDGKKFCSAEYNDDLLRSISFYDKAGKLTSHAERNGDGWEHDVYLPDGLTKTAHQQYDRKGLLTGTKTLYFPSGATSQTIEYRDGQANGNTVFYYRNGRRKSEQQWTNGKQDGHYIGYYSNGQVQSEGWFRDDQAQGAWAFYDEMGNKSAEAYYLDGDLHGYRTEYYVNGKPSQEEHYHYGWLTELKQFDTTGHLLIRDSFPQGSGKYLLLYPSGAKWVEASMNQGAFDGEYTMYYFDGSVELKKFYKRGLEDSTYTTYFFGGKKNVAGRYRRGTRWGTWNIYNEQGDLIESDFYNPDGVKRTEVTYFTDGKKDFEISYLHDERDSLSVKYDPSGSLSYAIRYREGNAIAYTYPGTDGKWVPEIKITPGLFSVHANFSDGRPSRRCTFKDGKITGSDTLFYSNGKIRTIDSADGGVNEGRDLRFGYEGQPESENYYHNDNLTGVSRTYFKDGKLAKEAPYYNGSILGAEKIYDEKGGLKETRYYYYGKLLSVKK